MFIHVCSFPLVHVSSGFIRTLLVIQDILQVWIMTDTTLKSKPHRVEAFRIAGRSAEDRGQHRAVEEGKQVSLCQGWWKCFQWVSSKGLRCSVVGAAAVAVAVVSQQGLSILDTGPCISRLDILYRYYMIRIDQMMHCFPTTTRQP